MVLASSLTVLILLIGGWTNGSGLMDFMLQLTAASGVIVYVFACITALVLKVRPVLASLGLLFALAILYGAGVEAVLLSIALMLAALPLYWLAQRSVRASTSSA